MSHTPLAPREPLRLDLEDIRCWLLEQIDGGEEVKGHDSMLSTYINTIDNALAALSSEKGATVEPRGCPTPGACSAVAEIADLKQRLLPQFQGRAQRAEHERDALLEELIAARSSMQQAYGCLWRYVGASNPMFLQARKVLLARLTNEQQAIGIRYANEVFGPTTEHEILHSDCSHDAAPSATAATDAEVDEFVRVARTFSDEHFQNSLVAELRRVYRALFALQDAPPVEVAEPDRPDWARQLPGAELYDRAARYEYIRTLNPRKFSALYNEAMVGVHQFDDLVDRYRDAGEKPK